MVSEEDGPTGESPEFQARCNRWSALLDEGVAVVHRLIHEVHEPTSLDAPVSRDQRRLEADDFDWPDYTMLGVGSGATRYLSVICRHSLGIAKLLSDGAVMMPIFPVVRAQVEAAGRATWLLEPLRSDRPSVTPRNRVARFYMEIYSGLCLHRYAAGRRNAPKQEIAEIKAGRDKFRRDFIDKAFGPEVDLRSTDRSKMAEWCVGGQPFLGLGGGAKLFNDICWPQARGTYDLLSNVSHPSLMTINLLTRPTEVGASEWVITDTMLAQQVLIAEACMRRVSNMVASYFGISDQGLEDWSLRMNRALAVSLGPP